MRFRRPAPDQPRDASSHDAGHANDAERRVEAYYDAYGPALFRHLRSVFRSPDQDCEDAVQDSFVQLLKALRDGTEDIDHPKAWLVTTAGRLITKRAKRARRFDAWRRDVLGGWWASPPPTGTTPSDDTRVHARRVAAAWKHAWWTMTRIERRCFSGRANGLTVSEIARIEHIDRRRAGEALARAFEKFRKSLEDRRDT